MARIPTYTAERGLEVGSAIGLPAFDQSLGRAIEGLGNAIGSINIGGRGRGGGQKAAQKKPANGSPARRIVPAVPIVGADDAWFSKVRAEAAVEWLRPEADPAEFEVYRQGVAKDAPTNKAKQVFLQWSTGFGGEIKQRADLQQNAALIAQRSDDFSAALSGHVALVTADPHQYETAMFRALTDLEVAQSWLGPEDEALLRRQTVAELQLARARTMVEKFPEAFEGEIAAEDDRYSMLAPAQITALQKEADSIIVEREAAADERLTRGDPGVDRQGFDLVASGKLTPEWYGENYDSLSYLAKRVVARATGSDLLPPREQYSQMKQEGLTPRRGRFGIPRHGSPLWHYSYRLDSENLGKVPYPGMPQDFDASAADEFWLMDVAHRNGGEAIAEAAGAYADGRISRNVFARVHSAAGKSASLPPHVRMTRAYVSNTNRPLSFAPQADFASHLESVRAFDDFVEKNPKATAKELKTFATDLVDDEGRRIRAEKRTGLSLPKLSGAPSREFMSPEVIAGTREKIVAGWIDGTLTEREVAEEAVKLKAWFEASDPEERKVILTGFTRRDYIQNSPNRDTPSKNIDDRREQPSVKPKALKQLMESPTDQVLEGFDQGFGRGEARRYLETVQGFEEMLQELEATGSSDAPDDDMVEALIELRDAGAIDGKTANGLLARYRKFRPGAQ